MKVRVKVDSDFGTCEEGDVFIEVDVDFIPHKGELFYLSEKDQQELENKVKDTPDIHYEYSKWFYYPSSEKIKAGKSITLKMFEHFGFYNAIWVVTRAILWDEEQMKYINYIVLGDGSETG
jgi:hypothetical protein